MELSIKSCNQHIITVYYFLIIVFNLLNKHIKQKKSDAEASLFNISLNTY